MVYGKLYKHSLKIYNSSQFQVRRMISHQRNKYFNVLASENAQNTYTVIALSRITAILRSYVR